MHILSDFQPGDRVIVAYYDGNEVDIQRHNGQVGTVIRHNGNFVVVDHDVKFRPDLDNDGGNAPNGNAWPYYPKELEFANYPTEGVVINDLL